MPRSACGVFREALILSEFLERDQVTRAELAQNLDLSPTAVRSELASLRRKGVITSVTKDPTRPKHGLPRPLRLVDPEKAREMYKNLPANIELEVAFRRADIAYERLERSEWALTQALASTTFSPEEVARRVKRIRTPKEAEKRIAAAKQEVREREETEAQ